MIKDIKELEPEAAVLRVEWTKAHNYWATFTRRFLAVKRRFDAGEYGSDWTMSRWLWIHAKLNERQIMDMLKVFERALADEERVQVQIENERIAREKRRAAAQAKATRAAQKAEKRRQREAELAAKCEASEAKRIAKEAAEADKKRLQRNKASRKYYRKTRDAALAAREEQERIAAAEAIAADTQVNPRAAVLLAEIDQIEKVNRVELGRRYAELQAMSNNNQLGLNPKTNKHWGWGAWCEVHIRRSVRDIYQCIEEFVRSSHKHSDNIVPLARSAS